MMYAKSAQGESSSYFREHILRDVRISDDLCFRYAPAKIIAILHMQFP
jgi:hypothetical protein